MNYCLFVEYFACNVCFCCFVRMCKPTARGSCIVVGVSYTNSHVYATKIMSNCAENCLCPFNIITSSMSLKIRFYVHWSVHRKCIFKYSQRYATLYNLFIFSEMLYMFQAVPPPIIRSSKLYIQRRVLCQTFIATCHCRGRVGISNSSTTLAGSLQGYS